MIDEKKLIEAIKKENGICFEIDFTIKPESEFIESLNRYTELIMQGVINLINSQPKCMEWIPVSERMPKDIDNRFFMCVVENHEEDPPMYLQYSEDAGFGIWNNVFDEHTLGFVDSYFNTNEELGYEKVIAWMELPEGYKMKGDRHD